MASITNEPVYEQTNQQIYLITIPPCGGKYVLVLFILLSQIAVIMQHITKVCTV